MLVNRSYDPATPELEQGPGCTHSKGKACSARLLHPGLVERVSGDTCESLVGGCFTTVPGLHGLSTEVRTPN